MSPSSLNSNRNISKKTIVLLKITPGKESRVIEDLEDFIYPYDQNVICKRTKYRGLLILESELPKNELIKLIKISGIGFIRDVVILNLLVHYRNWSKIIDYLCNLIPSNYEIVVKIKVRERSESILKVINKIIDLLRKKFKLVTKAKCIIRLETINDMIGISLENM